MNTDQMDIKQEKKIQFNEQPSSVRRGRWIIKGINYSRGYAKLVHLATREKRYVALLNYPGYRDRFSWALFEKAESAVARRNEVYRRLENLKTAAAKAMANKKDL